MIAPNELKARCILVPINSTRSRIECLPARPPDRGQPRCHYHYVRVRHTTAGGIEASIPRVRSLQFVAIPSTSGCVLYLILGINQSLGQQKYATVTTSHCDVELPQFAKDVRGHRYHS